jgi:aromatic ring-opening dioxygenase catalytic subunit (LigB family)
MNSTVSTSSDAAKERMPTLFIPHGAGTCFFMEWEPADTWSRTSQFLKTLANTLPKTPKARLVISAHWATKAFTLTSPSRPKLIYDYFGAPGGRALDDQI